MFRGAVLAQVDLGHLGLGQDEAFAERLALAGGQVRHLVDRRGQTLVDPPLDLAGSIGGLPPGPKVLFQLGRQGVWCEGEQVNPGWLWHAMRQS